MSEILKNSTIIFSPTSHSKSGETGQNKFQEKTEENNLDYSFVSFFPKNEKQKREQGKVEENKEEKSDKENWQITRILKNQ